MDIRVLGTTEVVVDGAKQALGAPMVRAVLADLSLSAARTVATSRLVEDLWGGSPPGTATHTVQAYISQLRRALIASPEPVLHTSGSGYLLDVARSQVDALRFSDLVADARAALSSGDAALAEGLLSSGLSLWRGPALVDIRDATFASFAAARLEDDRLVALEMLFDARLDLGQHRELVSDLQMAIADNPFREHLHAQLMTALYRSGRQAESLAAFQSARDRLVEELGVEPGRELRELERAVLEQAPELELSRAAHQKGPGASSVDSLFASWAAGAVPGQHTILRQQPIAGRAGGRSDGGWEQELSASWSSLSA